jgi:hypothetical protein
MSLDHEVEGFEGCFTGLGNTLGIEKVAKAKAA